MTNGGSAPCPPVTTAIVDSKTGYVLLASRTVGQARRVSPSSDPSAGLLPTLDDGVVRLRELLLTDVPDLLRHALEPGLHRWTSSFPEPYTRERAEQDVELAREGWHLGTGYVFVVEFAGRFAGLLEFTLDGAGRADLGFSLRTWARGQGLMTRALRLAIDWAFTRARIEVVHWRGQVGNWPSRRVAWALGFRVDAVVPGLLTHDDEQVDGWIAGIRPGQALRPVHPWLVPERITGRRVVLREQTEADLPRLVETRADPDTRRWLTGSPEVYTAGHAHRHRERARAEAAAGRAVSWTVADPDDDRLLGEVMVFLRRPPEGEIGYCTHPDARRRGLTLEAVRLAARHALLPRAEGGLGLDRVLLRAGEGNTGSRRIAEQAGFTYSGRDRRAVRSADGTMTDDVRYDLLADELPAVR